MAMPEGFLWGTATASYQIEGAGGEDGRGESIWDRFSHTPGRIKNGDTGDVACDHYHRYREDVALMKQMGLNAYRFSVAWPRVVPQGVGQVNAAGLDFYDRLVDELLGAGLRPFPTLYHWDLPQILQDRWGGWTGRDTADAFVEYAHAVSRRLGDRVKDWITLNEPWVSAWLGYWVGMHAPGYREPRLALQAAHHLLLAHGRAVPVLRANSRAARVGITVDLSPVEPASASPQDRAAADAVDVGRNRWFLDPIFHGRYPQLPVSLMGAEPPSLRPGDMEAMRAPLDFLGINYYQRMVWRADPTGHNPLGEQVRTEGTERTALDWEVYPQGLHDILLRVHRDYQPPALYVTENGAAFADTLTPDGAVHDDRRRAYLEEHFAAAERAVAAGVPLRGYFVWTLMDNFEWAEGYTARFGIVYVDFPTQRRIMKDSARWYAALLAGPGVGLTGWQRR